MLVWLVDIDNVARLRVASRLQVEGRREDKALAHYPVTVTGKSDLVKTPKHEPTTPIFFGLDERWIDVRPVLVSARVTDFTKRHLKKRLSNGGEIRLDRSRHRAFLSATHHEEDSTEQAQSPKGRFRLHRRTTVEPDTVASSGITILPVS